MWPAEFRPRFMAVRYENEHHKEKSEYAHPFIDDLLCVPIDRLIFLQKVELALGLPKKQSPSYLFVQEATEDIEIAKKVQLERVCDLGFAMPNPVPLAPGTSGHFYFRFPGQKPLLDVYGKVQTSIEHPDRPAEKLVFFSFFGLTKTMNKEIRAYLARDSGYKPFVDNRAEHFVFSEENIFFTE